MTSNLKHLTRLELGHGYRIAQLYCHNFGYHWAVACQVWHDSDMTVCVSVEATHKELDDAWNTMLERAHEVADGLYAAEKA